MTAQSEPLKHTLQSLEKAGAGNSSAAQAIRDEISLRSKQSEPLETPSELDVLIIRVLFGGKIPLDTDEQMQLARRIPEFRAAVERLIAREVRTTETHMLETPLKNLTMKQKLEAKQLIEYSIEHHTTLTNTESKDE